jgi:hypothetical protein
MTTSRWILLKMKKISNKSCTENQNTYFMFGNVFPKFVPFMRQCRKKCDGAREAADNRPMRVECWISKHTRPHPRPCTFTHSHTEICKAYCLSTVTIVSQKRLNVKSYVHCPSCLILSSTCCIYCAFLAMPQLITWSRFLSLSLISTSTHAHTDGQTKTHVQSLPNSKYTHT